MPGCGVMLSRRQLLLVLLWTFCCLATSPLSAYAQWTFQPSPPLLGAPFRVSTTLPTVIQIFIAKTPSCAEAASGGTTTTLVGGSAVFQVTSLTNQTEYAICDATTYQMLTSLTMQAVSFTPKFALRTVPTDVQFSDASPVGATLQWRSFSDCSGSIGAQQTIPSTRAVSLTLSNSAFYFVCLTFTSPITGQSVTLNVGQFVSTDSSSFSPSSTITNQLAVFEIAGAAPPNTVTFLSASSECKTVDNGPATAGGSFGKTVTTRILLPKGLYTFCIEVPLNSGIYIPSGQLTVRQYYINPTTLFSGKLTELWTTLDTNPTATIALSSSQSCAQPFTVVAATVNSRTTWTPLQATSLYGCVYEPSLSVYIYTNPIQVVAPYVVNASRSVLIRGLSVLVQSTPAAIMRFSDGLCSSTVTYATTQTATTSGLLLVANASFQAATATLCVLTVDGSYWYAVQTLSVRDYQWYHLPWFATEASSFAVETGVLSSMTPSSSLYASSVAFSASLSSCASFVVSQQPANTTLTFVFPQAGPLLLCVDTGLGFIPIRTTVVYPLPSLSPITALALQQSTITLRGVPLNFDAFFGALSASCSAMSGSNSLLVQPTSDPYAFSVIRPVGAYHVCVPYPDTVETRFSRDLGRVDFFNVTHRPTVHNVGSTTASPSIFELLCDVPSLLVGQSFFVGRSCSTGESSRVSTIGVIDSDRKVTAVIPETVTPGLYEACVGNSSAGYVSAGSTTLIQSLEVAVPTLLRGLPFHLQFAVSGAWYVPSLVTLSSGPNCSHSSVFVSSASVSTTTGKTLTPLVVPTNSAHRICAYSTDDVTLLDVGVLSATPLVATTTTFQTNKAAVLTGLPLLNDTFLALSLSPSCASGTTRYPSSSALAAAAGTYTLCEVLTADPQYAASSINTVLVVATFTAELPSVTYSFTPFVVAVTGGDTAGRSTVTLYLVPASTTCNNVSAAIATFQGPPSAVTVTIPTLPLASSRLCVQSADEDVTNELAVLTPLPYVTPQSAVKGSPATFTNRATASGFALLSNTSACLQDLMSPRAFSNFAFTVPVVPRTAGSIGYYCESSDGAVFTLKARIVLISLTDPTTGGQTGIVNQSYAPTQSIVASVDPSVGVDPFISTTSDCASSIDLSQGVVPTEAQDLFYFLCVVSVDRTIVFTTPYPSIRVVRYQVTPSAFNQQYSRTVWMNPAPVSTLPLFVSSTSDCASSLGDLRVSSTTGLGSVMFANTAGLMYLCARWGGAVPRIATWLNVVAGTVTLTSPSVVHVAPCVRITDSAYYSYTLPESLSSSLYSSYVPYYNSTNRTLFAASSASQCYSGQGLTPAAPASTADVTCFPMLASSRSSIVFCGGSPAGPLLLGTATLTTLSVNTTTLVSGSVTTVLVANGGGGLTYAIGTAGTCQSVVSTAATANTAGVVSLPVIDAQSGSFLPAGEYAICVLSQGSWYPVAASVQISATEYFSVANANLVSGVATTVQLLQDLTAAKVVSFSTHSDCSTTSSLITSWAAFSSTQLRVTSSSGVGTAVLCARASVNQSLIPVTLFRVAAQTVQFPRQFVPCVPIVFGGVATDVATTLTAVNGYCCHSPTASVVTTATWTSSGTRTMTITEADLERAAPNRTFDVCLRNSSYCASIGSLTTPAGSACPSVPPTAAPSPDQNGNTNSSNGNRVDSFSGGALSSDRESIATWIILVVVFVVLLILLCCILFCCWYCRSRRVVPLDAEGGNTGAEEDEANSWKRTFDAIVSTNKQSQATRDVINEMLRIPISMKLSNCVEPPLQMQRLAIVERNERAAVEARYEAVLRDLYLQLQRERQDLQLALAAAEQERIYGSITKLLYAECHEVMLVESEGRTQTLDDEERERLALFEAERAAWRNQMDIEGQRLRATLEQDPYWRSRRRLLREVNQRAMQGLAVSPAVQSQHQLSYSAGGGGGGVGFPQPSSQHYSAAVDPHGSMDGAYPSKQLW